MWIGVRQRFSRFHDNIKITTEQRKDGLTKQRGVRQSLQRAYYDITSSHPPGLIVGSWGQRTETRPTNDVDIFFFLPFREFDRINAYSGNKQSALLQEVKEHLLGTYPQSRMRGDGQVVQIAFNTINVEIVPVFEGINNRQFIMPDSNNGGSWKTVDPYAEQDWIENIDKNCVGNARSMAKMLKVWKRHCNVPLKSYQVVLLVVEFMSQYEFRQRNYFWYDWFIRDFFIFLCGLQFCDLTIPGTGESINLGNQWHSRAISARDRALKACNYEYNDLTISAGEEWKKIFGGQIPVHVT